MSKIAASFAIGLAVFAAPVWSDLVCPACLPLPSLAPGDRFGATVAVSSEGTQIAVGAYLAGKGDGAVYLYHRDGSGWAGPSMLTGMAGEELGFSLAFVGNDLLIGAPFARGAGGARCGVVYRGFSKVPLAGLPCEEGAETGSSLAVSGSSVAVGARGAAGRAGRLYIDTGTGFTEHGGGLTEPGAELGTSVAMYGQAVVAGAPFAAVSGRAFLFSADSVKMLSPQSSTTRDAFGYAVAISGSTIAVGAPLANGENGAVHLFNSEGAETGVASRPSPKAQLGVALAFAYNAPYAGNVLYAGARHAGGAGAVYPISGDSPLSFTPPSGAEFGFDLAGTQNILVVGAFGEGNGRGDAYVFGAPRPPPGGVTVSFAKSLDSVGETDGGIDVTVTVEPAPAVPVTVFVSTADDEGTAKAGIDYAGTHKELSISGTQATLRIPVFSDGVCTGDKMFFVHLDLPASHPSNVSLGSMKTETVTIHDTPSVLLSPSTVAFLENDDPFPISVQLTCPPAGRVKVALSGVGMSATLAVLTFSAGSTVPQQVMVAAGDCLTDPWFTIKATVKESLDPRYTPDLSGETFAECVSADAPPAKPAPDGTMLTTFTLTNHGPWDVAFAHAFPVDGLSPVWAGAKIGAAQVDFEENRVLWSGTLPAEKKPVLIFVTGAPELNP